MFTITEGCDTFGQITALSRWLKLQPRAGRLTLLTSDAHLERTMAITRIMIEPLGWTVEGVPVSTGDHRPENIWRLYRDQFRARLWRLTGWGAAPDALCREREEARSR